VTPIHLTVVRGARTGTPARFDGGPVRIGRSPKSDLPLQSDSDHTVSESHAVLDERNGFWFVRDAGSTNGTLLNGEPVESWADLHDGDRIGLGTTGPVVHVECGRPRTSVPPHAGTSRRPGGTGFAADRRRPMWMLAALLFTVIVIVAVVVPLRQERARVQALTERLDSLQRTSGRVIAGLRDQLSGMQSALESSRTELRELGDELDAARASGDRQETEALEQRVEEAAAELERRERAAGIDFERAVAPNRPALAEVFVELGPDQVLTATAFAVRADGLLLTNRHVVDEVSGTDARIAVQFSGSDQVWPATVLAMSDEADLAALRVQGIVGEVPTVTGFHRRVDTLPAGIPVVVIGFPLGGVTTPSEAPEATVGAGTVRAVLPTQLQVDGYGAPGASGSPVLDTDGAVLGVVRGGEERPDGTTLVAVPASIALRFVENVLALERAGAG